MRILVYLFLLTSTLVVAQSKKQISLDDIWLNGTFSAKGFSGFNFMKDGMFYTEVKDNELLKKEVKTGIVASTLIKDGDISWEGQKIQLNDFELSEDESKIIIKTEREGIYRRSAKAYTFVYDLKLKKTWKVSTEKVLHATLNPQSTKVAYVKVDNNLYLYDLLTNTEKAITTDGLKNNIINGNCDWVYEEEFEFTKAFEWNKNGDYVVYYKFDETNVPQFNFVSYGKLYPDNYVYKYPKAGEDNSFVSIWSYNVMSGSNLKLFATKDHMEYIPRIKFTADANTLCIFNLNRHQDNLKLHFSNITSGSIAVQYEEKNKAYIEINDNLTFLQDGKSMVYSSEKDGWHHLYLRIIASGVETCLTPGNFDIEEVKGVDEKNKLVYYTAAALTPTERDFYSVSFQGKNRTKLSQGNGMHRIVINTNFTLFTDNYSTANTPPTYSLCDMKGKTIKVIEDNMILKNRMAEFDFSQLEFSSINNLNAWIIKPSSFDSNKKYPVLMFVYGGPGSQTVTNAWFGSNYLWFQMLAQKGYIVVSVDNTGTGFRGEEFKKKTYLQLGKYESEDQIAAAKTIATWSYVNAARIGIFGWSYGGFMSSTCITKGADVFKTAIAVAPVTNWRYYDNIYTERYMRTPAENASGYDENSPVNMVSQLKGNYLLIHGMSDDNVHFQNSVMMIDEMVKKAKVFDTEIYPNKNHGISGGKTRFQLYSKMTRYLLENL